ncbi:hypothetical protein AAH978_21120 [Streptomyces sp. ZYX-F-203]|nr:hypothetical protein [Streptomyces sp. HSG2]
MRIRTGVVAPRTPGLTPLPVRADAPLRVRGVVPFAVRTDVP